LREHPRYRVVRLLGKGGMGAVYLAMHQHLGRHVALKVIKRSLMEEPDAVQRFRREIRAVGQLSHPNIVQAHDADQAGDLHFLVMEYVEGQSLAEYLQAQGPLPVAEACEYARQTALGLQHAHDQGLSHRDIKPHNLMRTPTGQVKILDFGLAHVAGGPGADAQLTGTGVAMGTADYIAPEQASNARAADIRADVYSLGCTLYHLLTGRTPYPGGTHVEKMLKHIQQEPTPLEQLRADLPAGLVEVVARMMAKDPADRYQEPAQVAAALAAFVAAPSGPLALPVARTLIEPAPDAVPVVRTIIEGKPAGPLVDRTAAITKLETLPPSRRFRPGRLLLVAGGLAVAALLVVLGVVVVRFADDKGELIVEVADDAVEVVAKRGGVTVHDTRTGRNYLLRAGQHKLKPGKYQIEVTEVGGDMKLFTDEFTITRGDKTPVRVTFKPKVVAENNKPPHPAPPKALDPAEMAKRPVPADALKRESLSQVALALAGDGDPSRAPPELVAVLGDARFRLSGCPSFMNYSRDGKLLAIPSGNAVKVFDVATGQPRWTLLGHAAQVHMVTFSPDDQFLASCSDYEKEVKLWDVVQGRELRSFTGHQASVLALAFSPDSKTLATGGRDHRVLLWKVRTGEELYAFLVPPGVSDGLAFHPDGKILAAASDDGSVRLWDVGTKKQHNSLTHDRGVRKIIFSTDGRLFATSSDKTICLWDGRTFQKKWEVSGAGVGLTSFSPDGKTLLTAGHGHHDGSAHTVTLWDAKTSERRSTYPLQSQGGAAYLSLSPDGRTLAATGINIRVVRLYDADTGRARFPVTGHTVAVEHIAFSPDGKWLASGGSDGIVRLSDFAIGQEVRTLAGHTNNARSVAFSPDGKILASGSYDNTVRLWDPLTSRHLWTFSGHTAPVEQVAFSPDGKLLASAGHDSTVRLWDVTRRAEYGEPLRCSQSVFTVAFSPDGRSLAAGSQDGTARVWDVDTGVQQRTLKHSTSLKSISFLPDGQTIVTGGEDGVVRLWSLPEGALRRELPGRGSHLSGLAVRWDGRMLAAWGYDGAVRLWDLNTDPPQRQTLRLAPYGEHNFGIAFSPEGRHLAVANRDCAIYLFRLGPPRQAILPGLPRPDPVGTLVREFEGRQGNLYYPIFSRDGKRAFAPSGDGTVRVLDVPTGKLLRILRHPQGVVCLAGTPDDRFLLSTCHDGIVRIWDSEVGQVIRQLEGKHDSWGFAVSPDGREVFTEAGDFAVISDIDTGKELRRFIARSKPRASTPDGKQMLAYREGQLALFDSQNGEVVRRFAGHRAWIRDVAVSPDGRFGISCGGSSGGAPAGSIGDDCSVCLWDLRTGVQLWRRQESPYTRWSATFTPDSRRVVTSSSDHTVRVYETATGRELACLDCPSPIHGIAVSPDGKSVLAGGMDGVLRLYDLPALPDKPPAR